METYELFAARILVTLEDGLQHELRNLSDGRTMRVYRCASNGDVVLGDERIPRGEIRATLVAMFVSGDLQAT